MGGGIEVMVGRGGEYVGEKGGNNGDEDDSSAGGGCLSWLESEQIYWLAVASIYAELMEYKLMAPKG